MNHRLFAIGIATILVFATILIIVPSKSKAVINIPTLAKSATINGTGTSVNLPFTLPSGSTRLLLFVAYPTASNPCSVGTNSARFGEDGPLTLIACRNSDGYRSPIEVYGGSATSCSSNCNYFHWDRTSSTSVILNGQAWKKASTNTSIIVNGTASNGIWYPEVGILANAINGIAITHTNSVYIGGIIGSKFNAAHSYPTGTDGTEITGISSYVCWDVNDCYASAYTTGSILTFMQQQTNKAWAFNSFVVEIEGLDIPPWGSNLTFDPVDAIFLFFFFAILILMLIGAYNLRQRRGAT